MTPWAVSPSAGWSNSAAGAARPSILQAPSSSEYSEWTWRCTAGAKVGRLWGRDPTEPGRLEAKARSFRGFSTRVAGMLLGLALAAAVAGGNLPVTATPHPRI